MTVFSSGQDGDPPMNAQEVTRCLERELRLREGPNVAGSPSTPPTRASPLLHQLKQLQCISHACSSSQRGHLRGVGRGLGVSSSQSVSSDSSDGYLEGGNLATASSINSLPKAASARPLFPSGGPSNRIGSRGSQSSVIDQAGRGELMPSSPVPATTVGRGKNGLSANAAIGKAPKPKRKRPSKKPPTKIIEASQEELRATVQQLTGCPLPAIIVRPQPERPRPERSQPECPRGAAVPIGVDIVANPPSARPDCSSTHRIPAPSPSPTVSNRIPEATYSFRGSLGSSGRSSLNYCMGFEQAPFLFRDGDQEDVRPEESGIPDDEFRPKSASSYGHHRGTMKGTTPEVGEKAAITTGASFQAATPPVSETVHKREDIPRERMFLGAEDSFTPSPSEVLVPYRRRRDSVDDTRMEFDPDLLWEDWQPPFE